MMFRVLVQLGFANCSLTHGKNWKGKAKMPLNPPLARALRRHRPHPSLRLEHLSPTIPRRRRADASPGSKKATPHHLKRRPLLPRRAASTSPPKLDPQSSERKSWTMFRQNRARQMHRLKRHLLRENERSPLVLRVLLLLVRGQRSKAARLPQLRRRRNCSKMIRPVTLIKAPV